MRRHAKASSAGSTQGSGTLRARVRRAFATLSSLLRANGTGAPSHRRLAIACALIAATALLCGSSLSAASAAEACPNAQLRSENDSLSLPDCRAYEAVSPLDAPDDVYVPSGPYGNEQIGDSVSNQPFQASASGDAATYGGDPLATGGTGIRGTGRGNEFLATRAADGWHTSNIQSSGAGENTHEAQQTQYQAFLFPLSLGVFSAFSQPLAATAQPQAPSTCGEHSTAALYTRTTDAANHALFTATQSPTGECGHPLFAAASTDGSQLFFQTEAALTTGAVEDPNPGESEVPCHLNCNLYVSVGGLSSLNLLPGGAPAPHATFGAPPLEGRAKEEEPDLSHAVSTDGSRAYWTDEETGTLYLRRNPAQPENCAVAGDACTVQVSGAGPARFWTATPDGRYAYYTEAGALWRFDAAGGAGHEREELVAAAEEVQGVIGVNEAGEAGSYLYFVAAGALPGTGATARTCKAAEGNNPEEEQELKEEEKEAKLPAHHGCNLYLLHGGEVKLIAALVPRDNHQDQAAQGNGHPDLPAGDWRPALGRRTARITPDGHSLVFQSILALTGYDNSAFAGNGVGSPDKFIEIFVYNADADNGSGQVSCSSCDPAGEPPLVFPGTSTYLPVSTAATYMRRWLSADGSRVFFDTSQPLLPADHNRQIDVYEWERLGTGSCVAGSGQNGNGCLYLLSSGRKELTPTDSQTLFTDASADGSHVFFVGRPPLLPGANETAKLYDAHENGGFPPSSELAPCEKEACKGPIASPPASTSPGTAGFSGPGNEKPKHHKKKHHKKRHHRKAHKRAGHNRGGHK